MPLSHYAELFMKSKNLLTISVNFICLFIPVDHDSCKRRKTGFAVEKKIA